MDPVESGTPSKEDILEFLLEVHQKNPALIPQLLSQNGVEEQEWNDFLVRRTECVKRIFEHQGSSTLVSIDAIKLLEEGKEDEAYKAQEEFLEGQEIASSATLPYFGLIMELVDGKTTPCHTQMPLGGGRSTPILLLSPDLGAIRFMAQNIKEPNVEKLHIVQYDVNVLNKIDTITPSRIITDFGGLVL
jgi:hypothetical protein